MSVIRTVRGDLPSASLGITYPHEHIFTNPPSNVTDRDLELDNVEAAVRELSLFQAAGGQSLVDMSPRDYGRNAVALRHVAEQNNVHIICTTGWHKDAYCRPWVEDRTINDLADEMIRDIEEGIDGTEVRAGVIKAASSLNTITPAEEKVFRAAARAQRATGVAISTHTEAGTMGSEQVALFRSEGVDPSHIIIGHVDRNMDQTYHRALLHTGVTIVYDQISKEKYAPDSLRVQFILDLVKAGFSQQIMLSGDLARKSYWPSYGNWGGPGLTYILWRFVPWLREYGLGTEAIDEMLVHTPARSLSIVR
jgi:phosphotriesterase-related protein